LASGALGRFALGAFAVGRFVVAVPGFAAEGAAGFAGVLAGFAGAAAGLAGGFFVVVWALSRIAEEQTLTAIAVHARRRTLLSRSRFIPILILSAPFPRCHPVARRLINVGDPATNKGDFHVRIDKDFFVAELDVFCRLTPGGQDVIFACPTAIVFVC
jgi:hypothetical protein